MKVSNPPSNLPLYKEIGRRLGEGYQYDQKKLIRDICPSRTCQLPAKTTKSNRADTRHYSYAPLWRLRADVLFDPICAALDYPRPFRRSTARKAIGLFEGGRRDNFNQYFFTTFGQARRESVCMCEDRRDAHLSQALHLINGRTIDDAFQRNPKLVPYLMEQYDNPQSIVEEMSIRTLSRKPGKLELAGILKMFEGITDRNELQKHYHHVMWGLLNSSEFMFNH